MTAPLWWILIVALLGLGLAGTFLPYLPGTIIILLAAAVHRTVFGMDAGPTWFTLIGLALLTLASWAVDFLAGAAGARYFGATKAGAWGAILGATAGMFFGLPGILLGPVIGAVLAEILAGRKAGDAGKAGIGTAIGALSSFAVRFAVALVMIAWFLLDVLI